MAWLSLVYQIFEYAVRAMVQFKDTDEGREEWLDIIRAYETALRVDVDGDGEIGRVTTTPAQARAADVPADRRSIFDQ